MGWDLERVLAADAAFIFAVLRASERVELERAHTLFRTIRAALGGDEAFVRQMLGAVIGEVDAERQAAFAKVLAEAEKWQGKLE